MPSRSVVGFMIEHVHDRIPVLKAEAEAIGHGAVQTGTWLVGLSSGFLALVAANPTIAGSMSHETRQLLAFLLLVSVAAGVLQRILFQARQFPEWLLLIDLHSTLHGMQGEVVEPEKLEKEWNRDEIIERLKSGFDLDYNFLREYNVPIDGCRKAYVTQFDGWKEWETARLEKLGVLMMAYEGKTAEQSLRVLFPSLDPEGDLEKTRRKARRLMWVRRAATVCFYVAGVSFVAALVIVAQAI